MLVHADLAEVHVLMGGGVLWRHAEARVPGAVVDLPRQRALEGRSVEITNDYYVSGLLNRDEFERMKSSVDLELRAVETSIQQQTSSRVTTEAAIEFRSKWENSGIHWQRDLLSTLGVEIVVHPRPTHEGYTYPKYKDKWRFDPELIEIKWKA